MWITEYRKKLGMNTLEFAHAVSMLGAREHPSVRCSEPLLILLENRKGAVTHPRIANLLARACGATPKQRDMIVNAKHRGTWDGLEKRDDGGPHPALRATFPKGESSEGEASKSRHYAKGSPWGRLPAATTDKARKAFSDGKGQSGRTVVAVNIVGHVVKRYDSAVNAAAHMGFSETAVKNRCNHAVKCEFGPGRQVTFRWADEWERKSRGEQLLDVTDGAVENEKSHTKGQGKEVVVIDRYGHERGRYPSLHTAANAEEEDVMTVRARCRGKIKFEFQAGRDTTYRYAAEWDAMDEHAKRADLLAALTGRQVTVR